MVVVIEGVIVGCRHWRWSVVAVETGGSQWWLLRLEVTIGGSWGWRSPIVAVETGSEQWWLL